MNYKVGYLRCRIFPLILLATLAAAVSATAQQRKAQPPKSLRLYIFDCGSLNITDTSPYQLKKEELATNYMSVPCFLVAHPRGTPDSHTGHRRHRGRRRRQVRP